MQVNKEIEILPTVSIANPESLSDAVDIICNALKSFAYSKNEVELAKSTSTIDTQYDRTRLKNINHADCIPPISDRLLLNFKEAAMLLSMSEASLRDLVHKGQGPENVRRGKRVCFTQEGLKKYVDGLPREYPYQGVIETINAKGSRPATIEEQRAFGV